VTNWRNSGRKKNRELSGHLDERLQIDNSPEPSLADVAKTVHVMLSPSRLSNPTAGNITLDDLEHGNMEEYEDFLANEFHRPDYHTALLQKLQLQMSRMNPEERENFLKKIDNLVQLKKGTRTSTQTTSPSKLKTTEAHEDNEQSKVEKAESETERTSDEQVTDKLAESETERTSDEPVVDAVVDKME